MTGSPPESRNNAVTQCEISDTTHGRSSAMVDWRCSFIDLWTGDFHWFVLANKGVAHGKGEQRIRSTARESTSAAMEIE